MTNCVYVQATLLAGLIDMAEAGVVGCDGVGDTARGRSSEGRSGDEVREDERQLSDDSEDESSLSGVRKGVGRSTPWSGVGVVFSSAMGGTGDSELPAQKKVSTDTFSVVDTCFI